MIIRTPEQRFTVLRVLQRTEEQEICLCQELGREPEEVSTLIRFRNPARSRHLLPMMIRQKENPAFEDFLGVFTQQEDLCVRFRYSEAPSLQSWLQRDTLSLMERLEIGANLLERAMLLNMPAPILSEVLREENITVDEAMRVRFNYFLTTVLTAGQTDLGFICGRLYHLMQLLFAAELKTRALPPLDELLTRLREASFESLVEIYGAYDLFRQAVENQISIKPAEPQTWLFRLWAAVKKLSRFIKPVLGGLVLVAAFCYLIYTLLAPARPKGTPFFIDQIGTVEIEGIETPAP